MLVEDESLIRLVIAEIAADEGFDVMEARNGDEAASVFDQVDSFDVLFTDVQMPGKFDGIDVAVYAQQGIHDSRAGRLRSCREIGGRPPSNCWSRLSSSSTSPTVLKRSWRQ